MFIKPICKIVFPCYIVAMSRIHEPFNLRSGAGEPVGVDKPQVNCVSV